MCFIRSCTQCIKNAPEADCEIVLNDCVVHRLCLSLFKPISLQKLFYVEQATVTFYIISHESLLVVISFFMSLVNTIVQYDHMHSFNITKFLEYLLVVGGSLGLCSSYS